MDECTQSWYYDACTLDASLITHREILDNRKNHKIRAVTSHLGIGEAYSKCRLKGNEQLMAFAELVNLLKNHLDAPGNDGIEEELNFIRVECPRLSITDAIHFATALHLNCSNLRTTDPDLYSIGRKTVQKIAKKFNCKNFSITQIEFK